VDQVLRTALVLTAVALLGACSDDDDPGAPTSTTSETPAPAETTTSSTSTTEAAVPAIALRGDGLGVVDLGAPPAEAIEAVSAELGEPTVDRGWESTSGSYATCPGERIRVVDWGGLSLLFTDGETAHGTGEHLFTWQVTGAPPPVATAEGLGFGATAADAEELYPEMVQRVPAEDPFPAFLGIAAEGGQITAYLDDRDTITNLEAGTSCGE
jgi:hypothetical protein